MASNTYVALSTQTVSSPVASVTFSSIPQGYTDLVLIADVSMSSPSGTTYLIGQVGNGSIDTGSSYSSTVMVGNGSSASSYRTSNVTYFQFDTYLTGSNRAELRANFQNYSNTTTNKAILGRTDSAATNTSAIVSLWRSTNAINTIKIYDYTGNSFAVGSTFTLYGVAAASVGAKATGGTIYQDASYFYHVFTGNGTFTPSQSLSCDYLVIAGGGGGGTNGGAGGGAGGLLYASSSLTSGTGYSVTIGAGGAATASGTNSTFISSATGGGYGGGLIANGASGGSGGGGGSGYDFGGGPVAPGSGGAGTSGQGYAGGGGYALTTSTGSQVRGGGGGGAGAAGTSATASVAGVGGAGSSTYSSWTTATGMGVSGYLAGGGGGGAGSSYGVSVGGAGGGGNGGYGSTASVAGTANTGGGGGGGGNPTADGAAGGSGLVIVRYAK